VLIKGYKGVKSTLDSYSVTIFPDYAFNLSANGDG
jgi:hypothetical protein